MHRTLPTLCLVLLISLVGCQAAAPPDPAEVSATEVDSNAEIAAIMLLQGEVSVVDATGARTPASLGAMLTRTHTIATGAAAAVILHLHNNHLVRIDEAVELRVGDIAMLDASPIELDAKRQLASLIQPEERAQLDGLQQAEEIAGWHARLSAGLVPSSVDEAPLEPPTVEPTPPTTPSPYAIRGPEEPVVRPPARDPEPPDSPRLQIVRGSPSDGAAMGRPEPVATTSAHSQGQAGCDDLNELEPTAMLGKLSDVQAACLEERLPEAGTSQNKISHLLMNNAFSKGDKRTLEKLAKRHVDQIDPTDADVYYKLAISRRKKGASGAEAAIRYADAALQHQAVWSGQTKQVRVHNTYKVRAQAAETVWKHATSNGGDVDATAKRTAEYARDWMRNAAEVGKDPAPGKTLCIAAGESETYCGE